MDEEGIVYADLDMEQMIDAKTLHDVVGHYNRFDILSILYRRRTPKSIIFEDEEKRAKGGDEIAVLIRSLLEKLESSEELAQGSSSEIKEIKTILGKVSTEE